jgi:hypothetical protein
MLFALLFAPLALAPSPPPQREPLFTEAAVLRERGPSPEYYRLSPRVTYGLMRSQIGAQLCFEAGCGGVAFTLDVLTGAVVRFGRTSRWGAIVQGGYSYVGFGQHLAVAGLGLFGGLARSEDPRAAITSTAATITIDALAGSVHGQPALGARVSASFGPRWFSVALGYQLVRTETSVSHQVRLTIGPIDALGDGR